MSDLMRPDGTDINGLLPCPFCGTCGNVKSQTPPDDDGIVRHSFFRCFTCFEVSPDVPDWAPIHWQESGSVKWAPLRDFYNAWVCEKDSKAPAK